MIRVLVPVGALSDGVVVTLEEEEAHHLDVRRVADGRSVMALDGAGMRATGKVIKLGRHWELTVASVAEEVRPVALVLAVGGGDKDRFLWLAEKAAELGVTQLVPLETTRSRNVENRLREGTLEKARRRAREACKQSGNLWAPVVHDMTAVESLAGRLPDVAWLLADASGAIAPPMASDAAVGWLIGPEGGFSGEDLALIARCLAPRSVTLGRHMLRFETAAIAAAVITADRRASN